MKTVLNIAGILMLILFITINFGYASEVNIIQKIDKLQMEGMFDINSASLYKIYSLVKPERLPGDLRSQDFSTPFCGTPVLFDVLRNEENLRPVVVSEIRSLLLPVVPQEQTIDSEKYPLRLHYPGSTPQDVINEYLEFSETSWQREVDEIGFIAPPPDGEHGGNEYFDIYFESIGQGMGGYTAPLGVYPDVDWYSLTSYCVINTDLPDYAIHPVIAHEFNHACQVSMDGSETSLIMEATATYMMNVVFESESTLSMMSNYLPSFQDVPHRSIDYFSQNDAYAYGAFLFPQFLSEYYDNSGTDIIIKIWQGTMQESEINEPDFLDSISLLVDEYAGHNLNNMYREFATWRYFTGSNDDGNHFENGRQYNYTVHFEKIFTVTDIPINGYCSENQPWEYGANYIDFDFANFPSGGLFIVFTGNPDKLWSADMILIPSGSLFVEYREIVKMGDSSGSLFLPDINSISRATLVISNLSDGNHDPDFSDWSGSDYSISVDVLNDLKTTVNLNKQRYVIGDNLKAQLIVVNPEEERTVDVAVALQARGYLFFYPGWTQEFTKVTRSVEDASIYQEVIRKNRVGE